MSEYVITEEELKEHTKLCVAYGATDNVRTVGDISMKLDEMDAAIRSRPLSSALKAERERVLIPLLNQCKIEELNNKKRCDAGVDNISSFQLRARQAAFERCAIWIEEILRRGQP
jgi:hypothetical protein